MLLSHRFYPDLGGIETISEALAYDFTKAGHRVHIATWSQEGAQKKAFPFRIIRNPNTPKLLKEHLWADIVFENNPCIRLSWPSFFINRPSIISLQTWILQSKGASRWHYIVKKKRLRNAGSVVACSHAVRLQCCPNALVIPNGYVEDVFKILPHVQRSSDFIFLGRLVSDKGVDLAVETLHKLVQSSTLNIKNQQKFSLTIVGDGPERNRLEQLTASLNLTPNVNFTGALVGDDLVRCLNRHRFILVPSIWKEPFGIVALEGIACGCIPIVSDSGGLPDAVGNAGLIFKSGSIDSLIAVIHTIFENPELESRLRENAADHLKQHEQKLISQRYLAVIEETVSRVP